MPADEDDDSKRQKSADTSRSAKTLQERVAARHSAKLQEKAQRDVVQSRASKMTSATGTTSKLDTDRSADISPDLDMLSPQERLEKVWTLLEMPDNLKLDMAIKYSTDTYYTRILEAIEHWEKVTDLILKREELLGKLEKFERAASDPNRFFEKGDKGSSAKRLDEARQRSYYYKRIDHFEHEIKMELDHLKQSFKDEVTFKGRPYSDKIKWDRIEMLYWLQEERKQNAIKYEAMVKHLPVNLKTAQLDPLPHIEKIATF